MITPLLESLYRAAVIRERGIASRLVENSRGYFPEATERRWKQANRHRARIGAVLARRFRAAKGF